jgi:hypothetical protein
VDGETLAAIGHGRAPHLIPDQLNVVRVLTLNKTTEMSFDDVAGWFTTDAAANTDRAIA